MQQAGIPQSEWVFAEELIMNESSWNQYAINSSSGACGLTQALPCNKMPCDLSDAVCQLKWQRTYVDNRYGTYAAALDFWNAQEPHYY